jgi:hypothetical protein
VGQDLLLRGAPSDILTETPPHANFHCLPRFEENDPSTEFPPPHQMRW